MFFKSTVPISTFNGILIPFTFKVTTDLKWGFLGAFQVVLVVKNPPANAGDMRDGGSIPGSGRSPGEGHSNPLQYSFLENPHGRGAWQPTVNGVTKSQTQLK